MAETPLNRAVQSLEIVQAIETLEFHNTGYLARELVDTRARSIEKRRLIEEAVTTLRGPLSHFQQERDTYARLNLLSSQPVRTSIMPDRLRDDPADELGKGIADIARNLAPAEKADKVVTDVDRLNARRAGAADSAATRAG